MGSDDIEKVAQLQFSESRKKTEPKGSEMTFAPQGRNSTSKHGEVWAQNATSHFTRLGRGRCPYDPELIKIKKENKKNER